MSGVVMAYCMLDNGIHEIHPNNGNFTYRDNLFPPCKSQLNTKHNKKRYILTIS